ncbi:hypothetical protein DB35_10755 [Streptomyces abyssalis]|uniref:Uncharacterized protein n=1 Tax=Streptomyces abyssalis TaxID=933944 RepID=A0A1E7JHT8_9ACTN|nr:hypothetical protein [Streptomyces abyssalis]OEU86017.1 hypothetical protein AN215_27145 [Streptomyces abyssalis]OEU92517.1 hypothetical protein DB35_10755 [Streptomyces abyssalis]
MTDQSPTLAEQAAALRTEGEEVDPDSAVQALGLALRSADIMLPDLRADDCLCGHISTGPLIELGSVRPDVAVALAEVIAKGTRA